MTSNILSPFRIVFFFAFLVLSAGLVLFHLKIELFPQAGSSSLIITFEMPTSNPSALEQNVTTLIEGGCSGLAGLKKMSSRSFSEQGQVELTFDEHMDMEAVRLETQAVLRQVYPKLPAGIAFPSLYRYSANTERQEIPLLSYSLSAVESVTDIARVARKKLQQPLMIFPGIDEVSTDAKQNMQIVISFDKNKCKAFSIAPSGIAPLITSHFAASFPGQITLKNGYQYFVTVDDGPASLSSIRDIEIPREPHAAPVHIGDIASVYMEEQPTENYYRINGKNTLFMNIYAKKGENNIVLQTRIKDEVQRLISSLPPGYECRLFNDTLVDVRRDIVTNLRRIILSVFILLVFILAIYRNWKLLFNIMAGLVVSICVTVIITWLIGVDIDRFAISGFAISFGVMTDNSIVMLDHYRRFGNRSIFNAQLGATIASVIALSVQFFIPDLAGTRLTNFTIIIMIALLASLIASNWFTPAFYDLTFPAGYGRPATSFFSNSFAKKRRQIRFVRLYAYPLGVMGRYKKLTATSLMLAIGTPFFLLPTRWEGQRWFNNWYNQTLGSDFYLENIRPYADGFLGGSVRFFLENIHTDTDAHPGLQTKLYVKARLPFGSTPEQMDQILRRFETYISSVNGVDQCITIISGRQGSVEIRFKNNYANSSMPYHLKTVLADQSMLLDGVEWNIYGVGRGFSNTDVTEPPGFSMLLKGFNYDELKKQAAWLGQTLEDNPRVREVNTDANPDNTQETVSEYSFQPDRKKISLYRTDQYEILNTISSISKTQRPAGLLSVDNRTYPLVIKESSSDRYSIYDLLHTPLVFDQHRSIRIGEAGSIGLAKRSAVIFKENRQYFLLISYKFLGSIPAGAEYLKELLAEANKRLPMGYTATPFSRTPNWKNSNKLLLLTGILLLLIFVACSVLFEDLAQPFYVILTIGVSFIGPFLVFPLSDVYFDLGASISFVMTGSLIMNSAVYIVNDLNRLVRQRRSSAFWNRSLAKAVLYRSRTILLTTLATICGLLPLLMEGQQEEFWYPFAVGTIAGLTFGIVALLFILPMLMWKRK